MGSDDVPKRGPWSTAEDQTLLDLVPAQEPHNWVQLSTSIPGRSAKQCRERYHQNLKPGLNHSPITPEEGHMIEDFVVRHGKKWAECARILQGRSDNAVKNWWNGAQNRKKRQLRRHDFTGGQQAYGPGAYHHGNNYPAAYAPRQHIPQQPLPQFPQHRNHYPHYPVHNTGRPAVLQSDSERYHSQGSLTALQWTAASPAESAHESAPSMISDHYTTSPHESSRGLNSLPTTPTDLDSRSNSFSSRRPSLDATSDELEREGRLPSFRSAFPDIPEMRLEHPAKSDYEDRSIVPRSMASQELPPLRTAFPTGALRSPIYMRSPGSDDVHSDKKMNLSSILNASQ